MMSDDSEPFITAISECHCQSGIPEGNGIDYLRDVNVAVRDVIKLLNDTLQTIDRRLSSHPDLSLEPDADPVFSSEVKNRPDFYRSSTSDRVILFSIVRETLAEPIPKIISQSANDFLSKLKFLVEYTEERMNVSPTQQQEQDQKLRHAARSSRKIDIDIKLLKDALKVQRIEHKKSVDKINEELNSCRSSIDQRSKQIKNDIERIVNKSEMEMVEIYKDSVSRQELLRSEIKMVKTSLNNLRRNNILREKELRDKRCKVETQLQDCVAKYDADIGGRHRDMENSAEEFRLLNSQRETLENDVMIDLRNLHDDLQREKAEALRKILNEKVERFERNRAARVIQKAWRAFWERHCAKKKKKSRKK